MKWYSSYKYKPKHGTQIWVWNNQFHRKELLNAFWDENAWNPENMPKDYASIWSYVFEGEEPIEMD